MNNTKELASQALDASSEKWRTRLVEFKRISQLSDQAIAKRLNTTQSIVNRVRNGSLPMPWPMRVRFADLQYFRSVRRLVLELLPEQTSALLMAKHDAYLEKSLTKGMRDIPENDLAELKAGNEHPVWITLLNGLKEEFGSDQKVADAIGTTRSLLSVVRAGSARLPVEVKACVIGLTNYKINDEVMLSLLPAPTIAAVKEHADERPDPAADDKPYVWEEKKDGV